MTKPASRTPVILDTDIGSDIDDTWALAMMLKCPELDVRLVSTCTNDTVARARIVAKLLETAGRTDIPIAVGTNFHNNRYDHQEAWVAGYELADYPGLVHEDGVDAIIRTIMDSPTPVTLVCIGPLPNIGEALRREPAIATNARFVGMHGSVRRGYGDKPEISAECNVVNHTPDCQQAFTAAWDMTITPLDTCGLVRLDGEHYQAIRHSDDPLLMALMDNYRLWLEAIDGRSESFETQSSTLFDTVAVHLAFTTRHLVMQRLPIRVTDDGYTVIDQQAGKPMQVATQWADLEAFRSELVERLTSPTILPT